ncbi:MAG TPA: NAD-dependent epimerase/dehydratase family protein [Pirellulales bacterium]|jgi:farnesol dehydrogenase|nr:NAD-dependent epimerase/dehydratase family protein [Pirellulales bacterium]
MLEPTTTFVTGATGFIGSKLVHELAQQGHRVRALSRQAQPKPVPGLKQAGFDFQHPNIELVQGDIADRAALQRGMAGCTQVFHLAGYAKNWAPQRQTYWDTNVEGLRNICETAQRLKVSKVVWTSTMLTFGSTPPGMVGDEAMPRMRPDYLTDYEASKADGERLAQQFVESGLNVVIVNPGRVFGPGYLTEGNALAQIVDLYDRGRAPVLFNFGRNVGNYVYVDDVVQGHLGAMERGRSGEKYLLGGDNVSLKEFFRTIDRVSGKRHWQIPLLKYSALALAYLQQWRARWFGVYPQITPPWVRTFALEWAYSSAKAERELGYQPRSLEAGLRETYDWLRAIRREARS